MITVYHGSITEISHPKVIQGRDNLDFGKAFYVTRLEEQAAKWAKVVWSRYEEGTPYLNIYSLDLDGVLRNNYRLKIFENYDKEWLDFIVSSRRGLKPWQAFDLIEGGIANDKVIDTIEGYMAGDFSEEIAIGRLKYHNPNNQIAILNQHIVDDHLVFIGSIRLATE